MPDRFDKQAETAQAAAFGPPRVWGSRACKAYVTDTVCTHCPGAQTENLGRSTEKGMLLNCLRLLRNICFVWIGLPCLAGWALFMGEALAAIPDGLHRLQRNEYLVAADRTYVETQTSEILLADENLLGACNTAAFTFDPAAATLEVLEAWVLQPDGQRLDVPPENIFTRPSAAARNTPGFVASQTTTIEFPQLRIGSVVHCTWRHVVTKPAVFGFNVVLALGLGGHLRQELRIAAPASLPLQWGQRGGFAVNDGREGDTRILTAAIAVGAMPPAEVAMVSPVDVGPVFVATTLAGYEALGAVYAARSAGKATATSEIAALARDIAGDAKGLDAVRAVYDWVAAHIRYVAVFLNESDNVVPHDAATVLRNGYGDCKDHVVLMQALLGALDIRVLPALVNWGSSMEPLPLWSSASFNHVLAYLPDFDTYANPTDPFAVFGVLDSGLADKLTVIASENGEKRRTPALTSASNAYHCDAVMTVDADGTVHGQSRMTLSAGADGVVRRALAGAGSLTALASQLLQATPEGGYGGMRSTNTRDLAKSLAIEGHWTSPHGVVQSSPLVYMTVPLGLDVAPANNLRAYLTPGSSRRYPVIVGAREYSWHSTIALPPGAVVEHLPAAVDLLNPAGHFSASYEVVDGKITVKRVFVINKTTYPAKEYADVQSLLYAFIDDQRAVISYRPGN